MHVFAWNSNDFKDFQEGMIAKVGSGTAFSDIW